VKELRKMKKQLGWSNADIARALGVSEGGVNHWFRSDPVPAPETGLRLMRLLVEVLEHDCGKQMAENAGIEIKERM
jgi:transcriptional regulator with XRE-family HTH domain